MKRRNPTLAEIARALEFQSLRPPVIARVWVIHWPNIEPTVKRYQTPVMLSRVLDDHRAAIAAEPIPEGEG